MAKAEGRLRSELKKRRPFDSVAQEACLNLARTSSRAQIRFDRLFGEHGLTSSQYNILRILRGEGKPLPMLEIADRLIAAAPGITGLVDRLEAAGLAYRERSRTDRRVILVAVTEKARAILAEIDEPLRRLHEEVMSPLTREEQATLSELLEKLRSGADEPASASRREDRT